jgi:predicted MPP superfamily phosphohydrolase
MLGGLALPAVVAADAGWIESRALRVGTLTRGQTRRFVHFTDFHHKGDTRYAAEVVRTINGLAPDFVCFTGDLVEDRAFAAEALDFVRQITAPVYGSPGNHDYHCGVSFGEYEAAFAATGGAWLVDRGTVLDNGLELFGLGEFGWKPIPPRRAEQRIALMHYPFLADRLEPGAFDLMLAGHSHGGQVRLPLVGAPIVPWGVGAYQLGYYEAPAGPLYVGAGIGTYHLPIRINCPPEITIVTI